MDDLVKQATVFLEENYKRPIHTVAAGIKTKNGKVYMGLNVDHFSGFVCAETSVLATAMNSGESEFLEIVALRKETDGSIGIANPCGKCRQILHDYTPGIKVAVADCNETVVYSIEELLPFSFKRQREKIQEALTDGEREVIG